MEQFVYYNNTIRTDEIKYHKPRKKLATELRFRHPETKKKFRNDNLPICFAIWLCTCLDQYLDQYPDYNREPREGYGPEAERPFMPKKYLAAGIMVIYPCLSLKEIADITEASDNQLRVWRSNGRFCLHIKKARTAFVKYASQNLQNYLLAEEEDLGRDALPWLKNWTSTLGRLPAKMENEIINKVMKKIGHPKNKDINKLTTDSKRTYKRFLRLMIDLTINKMDTSGMNQKENNASFQTLAWYAFSSFKYILSDIESLTQKGQKEQEVNLYKLIAEEAITMNVLINKVEHYI